MLNKVFKKDKIKVKVEDTIGYVGVDLGKVGEDKTEHQKINVFESYNHTFAVNPYICSVCGKRGFANDLVLCDQVIGAGKNIICEECASKNGIQIKNTRSKL